MMKQTNAHLTDIILYRFLFIAPTCFVVSSSGSCHSVSAKLHKRVHAVLVVFFQKWMGQVLKNTIKTAWTHLR